MQRRLAVVVTYAVAAATWIVVSSWLVAGSAGDAAGEIAKGLLFTVVTAALLYLLVAAHDRKVGQASRRLRSLIEAAGDITFRMRVEPELRMEYLSDSIESLIGVPAENFVEQPENIFRLVHPEDRALVIELFESDDPSTTMSLRWVTTDGRTRHAKHDTFAIRDRRGRVVALEGRIRDVTDERLATAEAAVEEAVLGWIQDRVPIEVIFARTCERVTTLMEVELAWIGLPAPDGTVRVVATHGDDDYTDGLEVRWDAGPLAEGPTGVALREDRAVVTEPWHTTYLPWRDRATESGYTSALAVPVRWGGEVVAVLSVYSRYGNPFEAGFTARFDRVARRLALALDDRGVAELVGDGAGGGPREAPVPLPGDEACALITRGDLEVWWQPQVSAASGRPVALEALVRGRSREGELVLPAVLIPAAERADLMATLGRAVRSQAIEQARPWLQGSLERICLNVTVTELIDPSFVPELLGELDRAGIASHQIELELVETARLTDPAIRTLTLLHRAGLRVSIDDYGSGWASLGHLAHLPTNSLKIDRAFIRELGTSARTDAVVRSTIQLGAMLELTTIAEGVEHAEQAEQLAALGCDLLQGFHFSPPVPSAEVPGLLESVLPAGRPAPSAAGESARDRAPGRHPSRR